MPQLEGLRVNNTPEHYMGIALEQARKALENGAFPVGAVLVQEREGDDDAIIATAANQIAPKTLLEHAEVGLLREAERLLAEKSGLFKRKQCHLFTTLEPCMMCFGAALTFKCPVIHFGCEAPDGVATPVNAALVPFLGRTYGSFEVHGGVMREDCVQLFREFVEVPSNRKFAPLANEVIQYVEKSKRTAAMNFCRRTRKTLDCRDTYPKCREAGWKVTCPYSP
jgi:tRNA(adenine34) deaminase